MKKIIFALTVAALSMPALAQEVNLPQPGEQSPAVQMQQRDHEAFAKARKEHRAQMKATQEKMEKLVKEYDKLKAGKKKDAKRAEIEKEVAAIHEQQLKFKTEQLAQFEERLARMKAQLEQESSDSGRAEWVSQKTDAVIESKGDLKALFAPQPGMREGRGPRGHRPAFKGPRPPFPANGFGPQGPTQAQQ